MAWGSAALCDWGSRSIDISSLLLHRHSRLSFLLPLAGLQDIETTGRDAGLGGQDSQEEDKTPQEPCRQGSIPSRASCTTGECIGAWPIERGVRGGTVSQLQGTPADSLQVIVAWAAAAGDQQRLEPGAQPHLPNSNLISRYQNA